MNPINALSGKFPGRVFSVPLATPYVTADAGHLSVDSGWFSGQVFASLVEQSDARRSGRRGQCCGLLSKYSVDGGAGYEVGLRKLAQTLSLLAISKDSRPIQDKSFPSDMPAFESGPSHSGSDPLDDQAAFQLRDGSDDDDNGSAQGTTGIDLFSEADELDVEPVQLVEYVEEVFDRTCDPIRGPDQDHIELTAASIPHHGIQSWPTRLGAADGVGVFLRDPIAALLGHLPEIIELGFRMLIESRDSHVKGCTLHSLQHSNISEICKKIHYEEHSERSLS